MAFSKAIALTVILVVISLLSLSVVGLPSHPPDRDCARKDGDCRVWSCCSNLECNPSTKRCVSKDEVTEQPETNCVPRGGNCWSGEPGYDCCEGSFCFASGTCV